MAKGVQGEIFLIKNNDIEEFSITERSRNDKRIIFLKNLKNSFKGIELNNFLKNMISFIAKKIF